jgi:hypothetical protein
MASQHPSVDTEQITEQACSTRSHLYCMFILQAALLITMAVSMSMGLDTWSNGFSAGLVAGLCAGAIANAIFLLRR